MLALDQSTAITGFSILDANKKLVAYGYFDKKNISDTSEQGHTIKRYSLQEDIKSLFNKYPNIIQVVCEGVYYQNNPETHRKLSKVQASIQDICYRLNISCYDFNASKWRKYIDYEFGKQRKEQKTKAKEYALLIYPDLENNLKEDTYEAICMAIAYLNMIEEIVINQKILDNKIV